MKRIAYFGYVSAVEPLILNVRKVRFC